MESDEREITAPLDKLVGGQLEGERSLLEDLATQRAESATDRATFILIPGYNGIDLLARYRLVEGHELEAIARRIQGKGRRGGGGLWAKNMAAALDTMATACTGIFYQRDTDPAPQQLTVGGEPVENFGDPKLCEGLKILPMPDSVRKIITLVFKGNDIAISNHAMKLNRWFADTNSEVDDDFMGEAL
jgi:hypothetical protein